MSISPLSGRLLRSGTRAVVAARGAPDAGSFRLVSDVSQNLRPAGKDPFVDSQSPAEIHDLAGSLVSDVANPTVRLAEGPVFRLLQLLPSPRPGSAAALQSSDVDGHLVRKAFLSSDLFT